MFKNSTVKAIHIYNTYYVKLKKEKIKKIIYMKESRQYVDSSR